MSEQLSNLLSRLSDMKHLANPPVGEQAGSFSSYDRTSSYESETDSYCNWDANEDGTGIIRTENEEEVVVELEGSGVIWRVWSAKPEQGNINFYFDGEQQPSYSRPFKRFFEQLTDDVSPAGFPSLAPKLSGGYNSYIPIPFKDGIKITFSKEWGMYYHFTYSLFEQEDLPSFKEVVSKEGLLLLAEVDRALYARGDTYDIDCDKVSIDFAKEAIQSFELSHSGAITYLGVETNLEDFSLESQKTILRETLLTIYWDKQEQPAVEVPLGDFFGSAPGYNLVKSLALGMTEKRMYANWFMPFSDGAKVIFSYAGTENLQLQISYRFEKIPKKQTDQLLRFHSKWHQGDFKNWASERFEPGGDRHPDWPILLTNGSGRFCGIHLHVLDTWEQPTEESQTWWYGQWDDKTIDWWWGEGDEKFFVDGEKFPSTFGTGSEDYIGYAWAAEPPFALFDSAYATQSLMPIDGNGHTSVMRLQICDNVPFNQSFEGFIEKYKADTWGDTGVCIYEVTPYWYQDINSVDEYSLVSEEDRVRNI